MRSAKTVLASVMVVGFCALPLMSGCDRTESRSKEVTTKTKETPEGTVKTTETQEKKVDVDRK